jgi:hypothetical protein
MSAADKRVEELLERWLASIELHLKYVTLDDVTYSKTEAWPRHQRPTRWVLDLARTRLLELQAHVERYRAQGDRSFADSLELMSFLTTLLASEHIERFIPLATGKAPASTATTGNVEQPRLKPAPDKHSTAPRRTLPKRSSTRQTPASTPSQRTSALQSPAARTGSSPRTAPTAAPKPAPPLTPADQQVIQTVVADAVRFLEWGTEWPAVAAKIAHLAGRPAEDRVRQILRANRELIQQRSKRLAE